MRYAAGIEYVGTGFSGWQTQSNARSVQDAVERAFSRVANEPVAVVCAGRTDKGVHALGQVVHFDTSAERSARSWILGTNTALPDDVAIRWVVPVDAEFNARFSARARTYTYVILCSKVRSALLRDRTAWVHQRLDATRMHREAQVLVGQHDFSSFRASECQAKTAVRQLHRISVEARGDVVELSVTANAFLHHMVRNIAGCLLRIGKGEAEDGWLHAVLQARDRTAAAMTAEACGLYFMHVDYPDYPALPRHGNSPAFQWSESAAF